MATVPPSPRITTSTLAGSTAGPFELGFRLFEADAVSVFVNDIQQDSGYTLSAAFSNGYDDNATVTFDAALESGDVLTFAGDQVPERQADYLNTDGLLTKKLNIELARIWASLSEIRSNVKRAMKVSYGSPIPLDLIAGSDDRANRAVVFDESGMRLLTGPTSDEIESAQGYAEAAAAHAPYDSRAIAEAAEVPAPVQRIAYLDGDTLLEFIRDPLGTALTTAGGIKWSPAKFVSAGHFGATVGGVIDCTAAFNAFFAYIRNLAKFGQITAPHSVEDGEVSALILPGRYLCEGSVNATNIRGVGWTVVAHGAEIYSKATGKAALDLLGSRWGTIIGLKISGDETDKPRTGFQYGRTTVSTYSCDGMVFDRCKTDGYFSLSGVYNLASETDKHRDPIYFNSDNSASSYCMVFDGNNFWEATSDYVSASLLSGTVGMSNIQHNVDGGEIRKMAGGPVIWMSRAKQVKFHGSYCVSHDDAGVVMSDDGTGDAGGGGFSDINIDMHFETSGLTDCIRFEQQVVSVEWVNVRGFKFVDHAPFASNSIFKVDASVTTRVNLQNADISIPQTGITPTNGITGEPNKLYVTGKVQAKPAILRAFSMSGEVHVRDTTAVTTWPVGRYAIRDVAIRGLRNASLEANYDASIADNTAVAIPLPSVDQNGPALNGMFAIKGNQGSAGLVAYTASGGCSLVAGASPLTVTTGALSGETGTDGRLNVSVHTDGNLYIENRLGGTARVSVLFLV